MINNCIFCTLKEGWVLENELCYAVYDINPKSKGHLLIVPKEHYDHFFATPDDVKASMNEMLTLAKRYLDFKFCPGGYNIIVNVGECAGQEVYHTHLHLVPQYE